VTDINKESVVALAERIRCAVAEKKINIKSGKLSVTASFGVAPAAPVNDLNTAIAIADSALYRAKQDGRNNVCYTDRLLGNSDKDVTDRSEYNEKD
jgi:diguanylate cyclase (GGDEF)-like protein